MVKYQINRNLERMMTKLMSLCHHLLIPITVIKCSTQNLVRIQSTNEIDEGIVVLRQVNFMQ